MANLGQRGLITDPPVAVGELALDEVGDVVMGQLLESDGPEGGGEVLADVVVVAGHRGRLEAALFELQPRVEVLGDGLVVVGGGSWPARRPAPGAGRFGRRSGWGKPERRKVLRCQSGVGGRRPRSSVRGVDGRARGSGRRVVCRWRHDRRSGGTRGLGSGSWSWRSSLEWPIRHHGSSRRQVACPSATTSLQQVLKPLVSGRALDAMT
jgi:hypothetical protein